MVAACLPSGGSTSGSSPTSVSTGVRCEPDSAAAAESDAAAWVALYSARAAALAEVVRAESGGVDLGTLFVDEGFGTLDPDVLDDVMHTLEGLREGGRTVGIVSHVTELKSRVADRIEVLVRPDRTSTLRITA